MSFMEMAYNSGNDLFKGLYGWPRKWVLAVAVFGALVSCGLNQIDIEQIRARERVASDHSAASGPEDQRKISYRQGPCGMAAYGVLFLFGMGLNVLAWPFVDGTAARKLSDSWQVRVADPSPELLARVGTWREELLRELTSAKWMVMILAVLASVVPYLAYQYLGYRDVLWMGSTTAWGVVLLLMALPLPRERAVLTTTLVLAFYLAEQATISRDWMVASSPERLWVHAQALAVYSLLVLLAIPMHRFSRYNWEMGPEGKRSRCRE